MAGAVPRRIVGACLAAALLAACTGSGSDTPTAPPPIGPNTVQILAGSELQDIQPILPRIERDTGLDLRFTYTGSLDGADRIAHGDRDDVAWFSSGNYLSLAGASTKVLSKESIALSPVVLGVKTSLAVRFGWTGNPNVTWKDIAHRASSGELKYAMANPAASNSGFSALVGVTSAFAGTGNALTMDDIDVPGLKEFFAGQALTAGSSGFLADAYVRSQDSLGGLINYESILLSLNDEHRVRDPLTLIYPRDGIITADYPLMLLNPAKRSQYAKLAGELRSPAVQRWLMATTSRRPVIPQVHLDSRFPSAVLVELAFPSSLVVVNALVTTYLNEIVPPSHTIFVLDTSGSMDGARIDDLRRAMSALAGADTSLTGTFAQFRNRENVTIIPFSDTVHGAVTFSIRGTEATSPERLAIRQFVDHLVAGGNTAIYSALARAYQEALSSLARDPSRLTSIVLMTDGENNSGMSPRAFLLFLRFLPPQAHLVRTFPVLFGDASPDELRQIADVTGGKVFDSRTASLSQVFKEIRGYQ